MTPLGKLLFGAIGLLFAGGVGLMIWLAVGRGGSVRDGLRAAGWIVDEGARPGEWSARRERGGLSTSLAVSSSGVKSRSVWTSVKLPLATTGAGEVLVTARLPGFLAADGALHAALGLRAPPRWNGGTDTFRATCDGYASDEAAAARWLTADAAEAIANFNRGARRPVAVRFGDGNVEARWAAPPDDAAQIDAVAALLARLRRSGRETK